jgi:thiol:disulfide interchange protein DsbD
VELPHIEHFYREMKARGFGLVTVTKDKAPDVLKMVEYNGITHPIVSDTPDAATGQVFEKYRAYDGKHYLIDSDGRIVATFSKLGISLPVLKKMLARHGIGAADAPAPSGGASPAETRTPVAWRAAAGSATAAVGATIAVRLSATVEPGWRIYATTQTGSGPEPLVVSVPPNPIFAMAGPLKSPAPLVKFDPNFGADVATHEDRADFDLPVSIAASTRRGSHTLSVAAKYQTCNAVVCLPPQTEVLKIPVTVK